MSHPQQHAYVASVVAANPGLASGRVLEVGSYDVNGTIRDLFGGDYLGVDLTPGPGVDLVASGTDLDDPDGFDVTVSTECFEHDPRWRETFANMARLTRPGGLTVFTCASRGRVEHGTRRTLVGDSPGTQAEGSDYYRNVTADDFTGIDLDGWFRMWRFDTYALTGDLYFTGVRHGPGSGRLPDPPDPRALARMMPLHLRAARLPLLGLLAVTRSERAFQRLAVPYWMVLLRTANRLGLTVTG